MRSVSFRVSDGMYARIQEEAESQGVSVARFAREATIVRAAIWAYRNGRAWVDVEAWEAMADIVDRIDRHDAKRRAELARERRAARK